MIREFEEMGKQVHERLRGRAWVKLRRKLLAIEPLCRICKSEGRTTEAEEIDHIKPLAIGGSNDVENLRPLCKSCHQVETAKLFGGRGVRQTPRISYDAQGFIVEDAAD